MVPPIFLRSKNKKGKQGEKRKSFKAETIKRLSPKLKYYCSSHFKASGIQKKKIIFGQPWWRTILFRVSWPLHFEIYLAGPVYSVH